MIYVTGDTHADFHRFNTENFPEQKEMDKNDVLIICGDFGGVLYNEDNMSGMVSENYWLDWLNDKPFTTVFCDGNHENHKRLATFPVKEWCGGKVHEIRPSVLHLMRGEVFNIEETKFFVFGGAASHDIKDGILDWEKDYEKIKKWSRNPYKLFRIRDLTWWEEELPTEAEMEQGKNQLAKINYNVDYIITHSPPASMLAIMGHGMYEQDILTKYLENDIRSKTTFKTWIFGHMHENKNFHNGFINLYEQIVRII